MNATRDTAHIEALIAETSWVRALAARLTGSAEEAEDLVQETWVAALRRPPAGDRPLRPWLATVLRNRVRYLRRGAAARQSRESERAAGRGDESESVPPPGEWLERLERQELLSRLVRELPEDLREVCLLRFYEGLSSPEIGARIGAPDGTVRWRLKKAVDRLRDELDRRHGGDRQAWVTALAPLASAPERAALSASGVTVAAALALRVAGWAAVVVATITLGVAALRWMAGDDEARTPARADSALAVAGDAAAAEEERSAEAALRVEERRVAAPGGAARRGAPSAEVPATHVRLRVVDAVGRPVAGARLEVRFTGSLARTEERVRRRGLSAGLELARLAALRSDADGRIDVATSLLAEDVVADVRLIGPGFATWRGDVAVAPGDDLDLGEIALDPRGRIAGTLRDASGRPCAGLVQIGRNASEDEARRRARGPRQLFGGTVVGDDGRFEFLAHVEGPLRVWGRTLETSSSQWGWSRQVEVVLGEERLVDVRLPAPDPTAEPDLVVRILGPGGEPRAARLEFRWTRPDGASVSGSTEAPEGEHTLRAPASAVAELEVVARDLAQELASVEARLEHPANPVVLRLAPAPTATRTLRVVGPDGVSLDAFRVRVHARGTYRHLEARAAAGGFELRVPAGPGERFGLEVDAPGCVRFEAEGLMAELVDDPWVLSLAALPGIRGRVTRGGEPVENAAIRVSHRCDPGEWCGEDGRVEGVRWGAGWDARTDAEGRFHLPLQYAGDWVLRARASGAADALVDLGGYEPAAGRLGIEIALEEPGAVAGSVRRADGSPAAGVLVIASHPEHEGDTTQADRDGRFRFAGLAPGDWYVVALPGVRSVSQNAVLETDPDWRHPANCRVAPGRATTHAIELPDPERFVLDLHLAIAADDLAALESPLRFSARPDGRRDPFRVVPAPGVERGADGSFRLALPGPGAYVLRLAGSGVPFVLERELAVEGPPAPLALELALARLAGGASGEEGAGARLRFAADLGGWRARASARLDADGRFGPLALPAGTWSAELPDALAGRGPAEVVLAPGETRELGIR